MSETKISEETHLPYKSGKIILTIDGELVFLDVFDIIRLQTDGACTVFFTKDKNTYTVNLSLDECVQLLESYSFFRAHEYHLINTNHISKYIKGKRRHFIMSDDSTVDISLPKSEEFLKTLDI